MCLVAQMIWYLVRGTVTNFWMSKYNNIIFNLIFLLILAFKNTSKRQTLMMKRVSYVLDQCFGQGSANYMIILRESYKNYKDLHTTLFFVIIFLYFIYKVCCQLKLVTNLHYLMFPIKPMLKGNLTYLCWHQRN